MIILGLDPGSLKTGYALIERRGSRLRWLGGGLLRPPRGADLPSRLYVLHEGLGRVLGEWRPDAVAVEECFMGRHARAALVLGHARGALLAAVMREAIPLAQYAPRLVKMSATGVGGASKSQVKAMVKRLVEGAPAHLSDDEADALAVAVCHSHRVPLAAVGDQSA